MNFINQTNTTNIIIKNVKFDKKYKGNYKKIFQILNSNSIFSETYETDDSPGFFNGVYYLQISCTLDCNEYEQISKLKNVTILD